MAEQSPDTTSTPETPAGETVPDAAPEQPRSALTSHEEAKPTGESYALSPEEQKSRKRRSLAIGGALVAFVVLIYLITMLKLSGNA